MSFFSDKQRQQANKKREAKKSTRPLRMEPLEHRHMLSITPGDLAAFNAIHGEKLGFEFEEESVLCYESPSVSENTLQMLVETGKYHSDGENILVDRNDGKPDLIVLKTGDALNDMLLSEYLQAPPGSDPAYLVGFETLTAAASQDSPFTLSALDFDADTEAMFQMFGITALAAKLETGPGGFTAEPDGIATINLEWTAPTLPEEAAVSKYEVAVIDPTGLIAFHEVAADKTEYSVENLKANTKYTLRIRALYGDNLSTDWSHLTNEAGKETPIATAKAMAPVAGVEGKADSQNSIEIEWDAHIDAVNGYVVTVTSSVKGEVIGTKGAFQVDSSCTSIAIPGLTPGATYSVTVQAVDAAGKLSAKPTAANMLKVAIPAIPVPASLTATAGTGANAGTIQLTWPAAGALTGSALQGYILSYTSGGVNITEELGASATSYTVKNLTAGGKYAFSIQAVYKDSTTNAVNNSAVVKSATISLSAVAGPRGLALIKDSATNHSVELTWTDSDTSECGYVVYYSSTNDPLDSLAITLKPESGDGDATNYTVDEDGKVGFTLEGLTAGSKYTIYVLGVGENGLLSGKSNTLSNIATTAKSSEVTNLDAVAVGGTCELSWTKNSDSNACYIVSYRIGSGQWTTVSYSGTEDAFPNSSTSAVIYDLTPGTTYSFRVQSVYEEGNLNLGAVKSYKIPAFAAPTLTAPVADDIGYNDIKLTWPRNPDVEEYAIYVDKVLIDTVLNDDDLGTDPTKAVYTLENIKNAAGRTVSLSAGTAYSIQVQAVDHGESDSKLSALSAARKITTKTLPAVTKITGSAADVGEMLVSWTAPTNIPDGFELVGYEIKHSGSSKGKVILTDTTLETVLYGARGAGTAFDVIESETLPNWVVLSGFITPNTNYAVTIMPLYTRTTGTGLEAETVGFFGKPLTTNVKSGTFAATTGLKTVETGTNSVRLAWNDNSLAEDGYYIYVLEQTRRVEIGVGANSALIDGLEAGTTYTFYILAANDDQLSLKSANAKVKTAVLPTVAKLKATSGGAGHIELTWDNPKAPFDARISGYEIKYGETTKTVELMSDDPLPTSYTIKDATLAGGATVATIEVKAVYTRADGTSETLGSSAAAMLKNVKVAADGPTKGLAVVKGTLDMDGCALNWTANPNATGYKVEVRLKGKTELLMTFGTGEGDDAKIPGTATSYSLNGLPSGTAFDVTLITLFAADKTENTKISLTTSKAPEITGLKAVSVDSDSVYLSWTAPAAAKIPAGMTLLGYDIYNADGTKLNTANSGALITDTGFLYTLATPSTTKVSYRVKAVFKNIDSETIESTGLTAAVGTAAALVAPTGLRVDRAGTDSVTISWNPNEDATCGYIVSVPGFDKVTIADNTETSITLTSLDMDKAYTATVVASAGSTTAQNKSATLKFTVPGYEPVTGLTAAALGQTQVLVSWTPPEVPVDLTLLGYNVSFASRTVFVEQEAGEDMLTSTIIGDGTGQDAALQPGATYTFIVTPVYAYTAEMTDEEGDPVDDYEEHLGKEAKSKAVKMSATILQVKGLALTETAHDSFKIQWDANPDADHYLVSITSSVKGEILNTNDGNNIFEVAGNKTEFDYGALVGSYSAEPLTPGAKYTITVTAVDAQQKSSPASAKVVASMSAVAVPKGLKATMIGNDEALLTWTPLTAADLAKLPPGVVFSHYRVEQYERGDTSLKNWEEIKDIDASSVHITGLSRGTQYDFTIEAVYKVGESGTMNSTVTKASGKTGNGVAWNTSVAATKVGYDTLTLNWLPAAWATKYEIYTIDGKDHVRLGQVTGETTIDLSGFSAGTKYTFYVIASNTDMVSAPSKNCVVTTLKAGAVSKPKLSTGGASKDSLTLEWTAPTDVPEGYKVDHYELTAYDNAGCKAGSACTAGLSCVVPGLDSGVKYTVSIQPVYKEDVADDAKEFLGPKVNVSATTQKFAAPAGVKVLNSGPGYVELVCNAYADAATVSYSYDVAWFLGNIKIGSQTFAKTADTDEGIEAYTLTDGKPTFHIAGLLESTKYTFEVTASYEFDEDSGCRHVSTAAKATVTTKADFAVALTAAPKGTTNPSDFNTYTDLLLAWKTPETLPVGVAGVGYVLQYSSVANGEFVNVPTANYKETTAGSGIYHVTGLLPGLSYSFRLQTISYATKAAEGGALSDEMGTGTSKVLTLKTAVYTAPAGFNTVAGQIGPTSVLFTCNKPTTEPTYYTITWTDGAVYSETFYAPGTENLPEGATTWTYADGDTSCKPQFSIPGLKPNTKYGFTITSSIEQDGDAATLVSAAASKAVTTGKFTAPKPVKGSNDLLPSGCTPYGSVVVSWTPATAINYDSAQIDYELSMRKGTSGEFALCEDVEFKTTEDGKTVYAVISDLESGTGYSFQLKVSYKNGTGDDAEIDGTAEAVSGLIPTSAMPNSPATTIVGAKTTDSSVQVQWNAIANNPYVDYVLKIVDEVTGEEIYPFAADELTGDSGWVDDVIAVITPPASGSVKYTADVYGLSPDAKYRFYVETIDKADAENVKTTAKASAALATTKKSALEAPAFSDGTAGDAKVVATFTEEQLKTMLSEDDMDDVSCSGTSVAAIKTIMDKHLTYTVRATLTEKDGDEDISVAYTADIDSIEYSTLADGVLTATITVKKDDTAGFTGSQKVTVQAVYPTDTVLDGSETGVKYTMVSYSKPSAAISVALGEVAP